MVGMTSVSVRLRWFICSKNAPCNALQGQRKFSEFGLTEDADSQGFHAKVEVSDLPNFRNFNCPKVWRIPEILICTDKLDLLQFLVSFHHI